jgi:hypothetical protein
VWAERSVVVAGGGELSFCINGSSEHYLAMLRPAI